MVASFDWGSIGPVANQFRLSRFEDVDVAVFGNESGLLLVTIEIVLVHASFVVAGDG